MFITTPGCLIGEVTSPAALSRGGLGLEGLGLFSWKTSQSWFNVPLWEGLGSDPFTSLPCSVPLVSTGLQPAEVSDTLEQREPFWTGGRSRGVDLHRLHLSEPLQDVRLEQGLVSCFKCVGDGTGPHWELVEEQENHWDPAAWLGVASGQ